MKKMKKVLAMMLSLAMVLGMSATVFAAGNTDPGTETIGNPGADSVVGTADDTGVITVGGVDEANVIVKAYEIVSALYQNKGSFSGYDNLYGINDIENPTESELANIAAGKTADGKDNKSLPTAITLKKAGGVYKSEALKIGMYLIIIEGSEAAVYNPAVASIYYKNENKVNVISSDLLTMGTTIAAPNTWVKKSNQPHLDKTVRNTTDDNDNEVGQDEVTGNKGNSTDIGDTVTYDVIIDPIPNYGGNFPVLNVVDTLDEGLTYTSGSLKVFIVNADDIVEEELAIEKYILETKGQTITVDFVKNNEYQLNGYEGKKVVIEYKAILNENAKINSIGNDNKATLNYSKNSTISGDDNKGSEDKETHTYTFDIDGTVKGEYQDVNTQHIINKIGERIDTTTIPGETVKEPVKNAKFGLFTDSDAKKPYVNKKENGTTHWDSQSIVTDDLGQTYMTGLDAGIYFLKELEAPAPYSVNTHIFKIEIKATIDERGTGLLESWSVEIDGTEIASFTINHIGKTITKVLTPDRVQDETPFDGFNIENTKLSSLPSTGGIGTTIFTIGGCIIMIAAAALFFASRRKSEK